MNGIDRPIFIVGVDHSGTTLLYRMMGHHPDLAWFSQWSLRGGELGGRARVPFHGWINRIGRRIVPFTWKKKEERGRPFPEPREASAIWRRLIPRTEGYLDETDCSEELVERVRAAVRTELAGWKMERILVKIPYLTRSVKLLDRIFPDAQVVHIVRDGKAVALSNRKRFKERGHDPDEALRISAEVWVETLDYLESSSQRLGDRLLTFRYEEFCEDIKGHLDEAFRFCGLRTDRSFLEPIPDTLEPTNQRRIDNCPPEERRMLDAILAPKLVKWGYEPFERPRPEPAPRAAAVAAK